MASTLKNIATREIITVQNAKAVGDHLLYQARLGVPSAKWQAKNNVYADGMDVNTGCCILRPVGGWDTVVANRKRSPRKKASVTAPVPATPTAPATIEPEPVPEPVKREPKKFVVPTMTQAESALSTLFAGVADQITQQVMDKAQPIFDEMEASDEESLVAFNAAI